MSKYTKELLLPLVKESVSLAEVIRKLGLKQCGGTQSHLKKRISDFGIDTSHFLGQSVNRGKRNKAAFKKKNSKDILCVQEIKPRAYLLRRALQEIGREYKCEECGLDPVWNGKELILQVDHISGNKLDNRPKNLRFICPNCHTQTENWGVRGMI